MKSSNNHLQYMWQLMLVVTQPFILLIKIHWFSSVRALQLIFMLLLTVALLFDFTLPALTSIVSRKQLLDGDTWWIIYQMKHQMFCVWLLLTRSTCQLCSNVPKSSCLVLNETVTVAATCRLHIVGLFSWGLLIHQSIQSLLLETQMHIKTKNITLGKRGSDRNQRHRVCLL